MYKIVKEDNLKPQDNIYAILNHSSPVKVSQIKSIQCLVAYYSKIISNSSQLLIPQIDCKQRI